MIIIITINIITIIIVIITVIVITILAIIKIILKNHKTTNNSRSFTLLHVYEKL